MKADDKPQQKKKRTGRPKGSKSGLPFTTFPEAIDYSKAIWEKAQYNEISFKEISQYMKLHEKKAVRVLSALKDFYGVVEKTASNTWRLTDAGKRLVKNDSTALKEVFMKDPMFADLYVSFGNKQVTEGVILDHIKKKYKGVDADEVKRRLMEGTDIIKQGTPQKNNTPQADSQIRQDSTLPLFQLRYALRPATNKEIHSLVAEAIKILGDSGDETLKLISELMEEKKGENQELANLLDKAMGRLNINFAKEKDTETDKEEDSSEK